MRVIFYFYLLITSFLKNLIIIERHIFSFFSKKNCICIYNEVVNSFFQYLFHDRNKFQTYYT